MKRIKQWWLVETSLTRTDQKETKKSLLILTLQHKSAICTIDAQKQILEIKIYLTASM